MSILLGENNPGPINADSDIMSFRPSYYTALMDFEIFWRDHQMWLEEKGYMLRPRYRPEWAPSANEDTNPHAFLEDTVVPQVRIISNSCIETASHCT